MPAFRDAERPAEPAAAAPAPRLVPVEFTGTAGAYFRIWTVNTALTIVTLGIYSAWAKVRAQRYFHGHTRIDGASFEYLAEPMQILKGRLLAAGVLVTYTGATHLVPVAGIVFGAGFALALPWLVTRALAFRAYHTAYRGVRFGFDGRYPEALRAYLLIPLLVPLTAGLAYPWAQYRQKRFVIDHARFGATPFRLETTVGEFYLVYLVAAGIVGAALLVTVGLKAAVPVPFLAVVPAIAYAYYRASTAVTNRAYNGTRLGPHGFESTLGGGRMLWIVATNTAAIVLSLGLLLPWARIRTMRYRAACLRVRAAGPLDDFVAGQEAQASALGEELGDFLGFDIGL